MGHHGVRWVHLGQRAPQVEIRPENRLYLICGADVNAALRIGQMTA